MKTHLIAGVGFSLLLIILLGCLNTGTLACEESQTGVYSSTINIFVYDKQTGQPIHDARIGVTKEIITVRNTETPAGCVLGSTITNEIIYESDINGQVSFSLSGNMHYQGDGIRLKIKVNANQYDSSLISWDVYPGINDINMRLLNIINQP